MVDNFSSFQKATTCKLFPNNLNREAQSNMWATTYNANHCRIFYSMWLHSFHSVILTYSSAALYKANTYSMLHCLKHYLQQCCTFWNVAYSNAARSKALYSACCTVWSITYNSAVLSEALPTAVLHWLKHYLQQCSTV